MTGHRAAGVSPFQPAAVTASQSASSGGVGDFVDTEAQGAEHRAVLTVKADANRRRFVAVEGHQAVVEPVGEGVRCGVADVGRQAGDGDHLGIVQIHQPGCSGAQRVRGEFRGSPIPRISGLTRPHAVKESLRVRDGVAGLVVSTVAGECSSIDHEIPAAARPARALQDRVAKR